MISLQNIEKSFSERGRKTEVFYDLCLDICEGSTVSIIGNSGIGKTTLLRIIAGMDINYNGRYLFNNQLQEQKVSSMSKFRLNTVGLIPQDYLLFSGDTCAKNIEFPLISMGIRKAERFDKVNHIMEQLNLTDLAAAYPHELSGGQCQRIAIARALVKSPSLIIADEPTGSLDTEMSEKMLSLLRIHSDAKCSILIATHSRTVMARSDFCYEIRNKCLSETRLDVSIC